VSREEAFVDEVLSELGTWPGVRVDRRPDGSVLVLYEQIELGVLDRDRGLAELRFAYPERDSLVEHGAAEPAEPVYDAEDVSHAVHGPGDITAVLELFDRRYRDLRGEDEPYSSSDPGYGAGEPG
jgi:Family of unknown function (DUF5519)